MSRFRTGFFSGFVSVPSRLLVKNIDDHVEKLFYIIGIALLGNREVVNTAGLFTSQLIIKIAKFLSDQKLSVHRRQSKLSSSKM